MIDFRYHLVSLIAVFLAVALGIVIGTTALNGPLTDNLQSQVSGLQQDKRDLEAQTSDLQAQLDAGDGFDEAVGPTLVSGALTDRSVVLVLAGGVASDDVDGVTSLLGDAGATVNGTVRLTDDYASSTKDTAVETYLAGDLPTGLPALPSSDDVGVRVAALLADVLQSPVAGDDPASSTTSAVLDELGDLGLLSTSGSSAVRAADYAVVLTAGTTTESDAATRLSRLVALATALDARGSGTVVAGDTASATDAGLVGAVRADDGAAGSVSTVDDVPAPAGQISTVLAVAAEGRGTTGAYGTGEDTEPVPELTP